MSFFDRILRRRSPRRDGDVSAPDDLRDGAELQLFVDRILAVAERSWDAPGRGPLGSDRRDCVAIGEDIDGLGGMAAMVAVHEQILAQRGRLPPAFARELEVAWDGIGEWRG